ncbi:hypothetical protein LPJ64_005711 [Coemansia asiatica]|uniref:FHF complex subunit HOOK-interacting protein C-terminal domain-containing protein n=1 Tax=Coemansia asiatica TaxID=1052880 RepID=A0A9W7XFX7_9FUNG|nr:hypothetical protein LPJ64_005711 [Coemansia asiatica]
MQRINHHSQARTTAAEVFDKVRSLVDNVSVVFDGPAPTARDKLVENWTRIQEHYTRQVDLRKVQIVDTTIPHHMEMMLKILAQEMLLNEEELAASQMALDDMDSGDRLAQPLEFGPCVEYLLQYHVLSDLVDLADVDLPRGMRKYVLRFFGLFIEGIPLGLLPESAIRLPLVAIMRQCLHVVQTSPTTPINPMRRQEPIQSSNKQVGAAKAGYRLGQGYHSIQNDKSSVILCHDLLQLIVTLFRRLREHSNMVYLFFDWESSGWQQQQQQSDHQASASASAKSSSDLAVSSLRSATSGYLEQSARGHELFIVHIIVEYLLAPGFTGQLAREALVLVVQVLLAPQDKAKYVGFLLDQARIVELLVEHMGYLHSQMPVFRPMPRSPSAQLFSRNYTGPRHLSPLQRRMAAGARGMQVVREKFDIKPRLHQQLSQDSLLRSIAQQDQRETEILVSARLILEHVDAFFLCWELLDEVAFVGMSDDRLLSAAQSQLMNGFLRSHIEPALLLANMALAKNQAITTVSYLADLVNVTHSTCVLDALFMVLLGTDLAPEKMPRLRKKHAECEEKKKSIFAEPCILSLEDQALLESIEDDAMRAEAAALLLPPGFDLSKVFSPSASSGTTFATDDMQISDLQQPNRGEQHQALRSMLISWMTVDDNTLLSFTTLRLFDTILSTMNQFAYTSLVLRNFLDHPIESTVSDQADSDNEEDDNRPLALARAQGSVNSSKNRFYSGPALGRGDSVAADQELIRAVVERFLDATPSSISSALPEVVVSAAIRLDNSKDNNEHSISPILTQQQLEAPRNFQNMRSLIMMREAQGCDEYVSDCLRKLRLNQQYTAQCWQSKEAFVRRYMPTVATSSSKQEVSGSGSADNDDVFGDDSEDLVVGRIDQELADFYPGSFLTTLISQLTCAIKRHMAYNLMVTSMINKLACLADPALCAFLFLANSATMPRKTEAAETDSLAMFLYDTFVGASADAYVKSERVPRFSARLARLRREGVETAVRVGAGHPGANNKSDRPGAVQTRGRLGDADDQDSMPLSELTRQQRVLQEPGLPSHSSSMDVDFVNSSQAPVLSPDPPQTSTVSKENNREDVAKATKLLGTTIKRFVNGYILLDEFGKEMAATALALHSVELDRTMEKTVHCQPLGSRKGDVEEYADLLEYYDPEEKAYRKAVVLKESLKSSVIDLGTGRDI